MNINYHEAAIKMLLDYAANVAQINEVQFEKHKAVREQRFIAASELRDKEIELIDKLPKAVDFRKLSEKFKSEIEQIATF